jgi:hypothetical protein
VSWVILNDIPAKADNDVYISMAWKNVRRDTKSAATKTMLLCVETAQTMVKVKLFLYFNRAPRQKSVLGEWRYSSTLS